ncbi:threonine synthase [Anaerococcus sp. AGMB00486]|uniref:Homoserine kinase n=1 Tax=Anaerococcus faecalis TaxID=2742993 RepID=A0ABX2N783_9FIRM|nr:homoserine kinase [Anaerococcus faecalis]NVF10552.1 threonine synthase [Anaerococcus faecalis]
MKFLSTRNKNIKMNGSMAIIKGIAPDGGLFVPEYFPKIEKLDSLIDYNYKDLAAYILGLYFDDLGDKVKDIAYKAYDSKFPNEVVVLKENDTVFLELYHGRTHAFKDMALSVLPHLLKASLEVNKDNKNILILVATSGDTGKASLEGFKNIDGVRCMVFYPKGGVSKIQELQMLTQEGDNLDVIAINGNFDNAQSAVKKIFIDQNYKNLLLKRGYELSSANSINIGRLIPQIVYYVYSYLKLVKIGKLNMGQKINICVPTGNFGNILAAYYAKRIGLPINKLIVASNENNVLTDFFNSGIYNSNRNLIITSSPSMDILISSNLERLLFHLVDGDTKKVKIAMEDLKNKKSYKWKDLDKSLIEAGFATEEDISNAIKTCYDNYNYVIDSHTAVSYSVYKSYKNRTSDNTLTLIASTASPFKFPDKVLNSIGIFKSKDDFKKLEDLAKLMKVDVPKNIKELENKKIMHHRVIDPKNMKKEVLEILNCKFSVKVPATSANIGVGFDTFGVSLNLFNTFIFKKSETFMEDNLVIDSYKKTFKYLDEDIIPISVKIKSQVPYTRGLGSSSTCIVAGVYSALFMMNKTINKELALDIATEIEGHPDNVAPAIMGSFVISLKHNEHIHYRRFELNKNLEFLALIPNFSLSTKDSRNILPKMISLKDGVHNVSRAALLTPALVNLDKNLIKVCLDDRFHQPYRKRLIKDFDLLKEKSLEFDAIATYLSGAGPTIMVLSEKNSKTYAMLKDYINNNLKNWDVKKLNIDLDGAKIIS